VKVERPNWAPEGVDLDRPSVARVYDYLLGGSHNVVVDREFADRMTAASPATPLVARENRAFARRAVRFATQSGIRQFLDLGSGIPTVGNVHEVAQEADPEARVVYVDHDPVAVTQARAILGDSPHVKVISADLRQPAEVLADRTLRATLDLNQPLAVLLASVLHFVPDSEHPENIVAGYVAAAAPGSYVVISHLSVEGLSDSAKEVVSMYERSGVQLIPRTRDDIVDMFGDLALIKPGVVPLSRWRPDPPTEDQPDDPLIAAHGGVGRKD
jgi:hypothetical protein